MKNYEVEVTRQVSDIAVINVKAKNAKEAKEKAIEYAQQELIMNNFSDPDYTAEVLSEK